MLLVCLDLLSSSCITKGESLMSDTNFLVKIYQIFNPPLFHVTLTYIGHSSNAPMN